MCSNVHEPQKHWVKNAGCKKGHTDWPHLYEVQEKAKLISGDRIVVAWEGGEGTEWGRAEGDFLRWRKGFISYIEWWLHGYIPLSKFTEPNPYSRWIVYKLYHNNRKKNLRNIEHVLIKVSFSEFLFKM